MLHSFTFTNIAFREAKNAALWRSATANVLTQFLRPTTVCHKLPWNRGATPFP
jgi:hypothetical protein